MQDFVSRVAIESCAIRALARRIALTDVAINQQSRAHAGSGGEDFQSFGLGRFRIRLLFSALRASGACAITSYHDKYLKEGVWHVFHLS